MGLVSRVVAQQRREVRLQKKRSKTRPYGCPLLFPVANFGPMLVAATLERESKHQKSSLELPTMVLAMTRPEASCLGHHLFCRMEGPFSL